MTKLNASGSALIFSTYIGYLFDDGGFAVDGAGNTFFTSYFYEGANRWVDVGKLNASGSDLIFDRAIGGVIPGPGDQNSDSAGQGLTLDSSGYLYITGYTRAADFPVTPGAYRTSIERYEDGFMMKLNPSDGSSIYSTYIPGNLSEYPYDIAADNAGNAYITGLTLSSDYPTTPGAFQTSCGDPTCSFLTKLNPSGSDLVYSTYLGGLDFHFSTQDVGYAVRLDQEGNAYVSGYTSAPDFPVVNPIQPTLRGSEDAFLTKFNPTGTGVLYSTYLGGNDGDGAIGMTLSNQGNVYLAGVTSSTDFPVVQPYQPTNHGSSDGFIMKIIPDSITPTPTRTGTPPTATPTACVPGVTSWRTEPAFSISRDYATAAVVGGKLYVIGGEHTGMEPPYIAQVERFDPVTSSWDTVAPIPVAASRMAAATVGTKIYVAGGWTVRQGFTLDLMQIYDTATNTWTQGSHLPGPRSGAVAVAYNGKVYIIGGAGDSSAASTVYEYDPTTNTYATKAPMPTAQDSMGAAAVGSRIYVAGGYDYVHYAYDPAANTWSTIADPPFSANFMWSGVFALNGELWVEGGYDNYNRRGYPPTQEVQIYNPSTNSWHFGPAFNAPRSRSRAVGVINGRGYVAGGADLTDDSVLLTSLESITYQVCGTATPTTTRTPSPSPTGTTALVGHVLWQGPPAQPNPRQVLPGILSLCVGGSPINYNVTTDASGFFTITTSLANGTYNWRFKGSRWLATVGTLTLSGGTSHTELGLQVTGDANGNNTVEAQDFTILRNAIGGSADLRGDFDNSGVVTILDFNLLRINFGALGSSLTCP